MTRQLTTAEEIASTLKSLRIGISHYPGRHPTIDEQLRKRGFTLNLAPFERMQLQRDYDELSRLWSRRVITNADYACAHTRLVKTIKKHLKPL
jgi:hypothetical protein